MEPHDFESFARRSWSEVRQFWDHLRAGAATRDDDPQPRLARTFFELFEKETDPDVRRRALGTAFTMWGNTGHTDAVDEAIARLDVSADYWGLVLNGFSNAYARSGRMDEATAMLHHYERVLTHPRSRAALLLDLARYYLRTQPDAAKPCYEEVVRLAVGLPSVREAEGGLYEIEHVRIGKEAPDFTATTLSGDTLSLRALRGSIVCLVFWDTECAPCWAEFPVLRSIHSEYSPPRLQLIGISSDRDAAALANVIEREHLAWPHIREEVTWDDRVVVFGPIRAAYNVWGVPTTILIDASGRIAAKYLRGDQLVHTVRRLVHQ